MSFPDGDEVVFSNVRLIITDKKTEISGLFTVELIKIQKYFVINQLKIWPCVMNSPTLRYKAFSAVIRIL